MSPQNMVITNYLEQQSMYIHAFVFVLSRSLRAVVEGNMAGINPLQSPYIDDLAASMKILQ